MPRVCWRLHGGRPVIEVTFHPPTDGQGFSRTLLADTGGGSQLSSWHVILSEDDCRQLALSAPASVRLGGAYAGDFHVFVVRASIGVLGITRRLIAVAVPAALLPAGLDGLAGFRFLSSFNYGNFGYPNQFCLETL
ncbi:MAG: hypothetical protein HY314_15635 [Acidobacteria bacterium]|nr:hypothetical protein [Acidobacteriota bacterium]